MRVLLLHSEDSALSGPWVGQKWDAIFDLARSGWAACERWSVAFGCPVKPVDGLREGYSDLRRVRDVMRAGIGRLVDGEGLDWWELTSMLIHQRLENLVLLWTLADELPRDAEFWITRNGFEAEALRFRVGSRLGVISTPRSNAATAIGRYLSRLWQLPLTQVAQTAGDKYDAGYRIRRHFHRAPRTADEPAVLVPSSYVNMSRTGVSCAQLLPGKAFLLVATRRSGWLPKTPGNVRQEWLASYAQNAQAGEISQLRHQWASLKKELCEVPELAALEQAGILDGFPRYFADGVAIRNAWLRLLTIESVSAVLCCDDSNPHTHIPLLLAKKRGLPTVACHHGALDGRYLFKRAHADVILAKGTMEQDYLVHTCGLDPSMVQIGAFSAPGFQGEKHGTRDWIVFFSEPYEMTGGRTDEIYRDLLPGMVHLGKQAGKKVVVKLHPSENVRNRQRMARAVLSQEEFAAVEWLTGGFGAKLLQNTWFGLTVQSSVAMECMVHGVPCFVCDWLDLWPYGYLGQFRKFGVGIALRSPQEIARIPQILETYSPDRKLVERCWVPICPDRLEAILSGRVAEEAAPIPLQRAQ